MPDQVSDQNEVVPPNTDASQNDQTVKYDTYAKLLSQHKTNKAKLSSVTEELNTLKAERQAAEEAALAEQGKFQQMFETKSKEVEMLQAKLGDYELQNVIRIKQDALKAALPTLRKEEYLKFADINSIQIDENGVVDMDSVASVANGFKQSYGDLLSTPNANLPNGAPKDGKIGLTYEQWLKLSAKEQMARSHEVKD